MNTCRMTICYQWYIFIYSQCMYVYIYLCFKVQPDLDELQMNMEDNEDAESTKSEVKLGRLQFSIDYDFQKGEVCY